MSTKTWQENLKDGFYKEFGSFHAPCNLENTPKSETDDWEILNYCEQFITNIRKQDEEELIKKLSFYTELGHCGSELFAKPIIKESVGDALKQLIKNYYENN